MVASHRLLFTLYDTDLCEKIWFEGTTIFKPMMFAAFGSAGTSWDSDAAAIFKDQLQPPSQYCHRC